MDDRKRILIIDDETDIAILLQQVLRDASFDAEIASNGPEGLAMAFASHFDLVLLDMRMPGMDGMAVLQSLRDEQSTKNTPVIFLTGNAMDVDVVVAALDLNPSDFITKMVSPRELIARIHWAFRKK